MLIKQGSSGFCSGVRRSVNMALEAAGIYKKVFTLGDLIHNSAVVESLKNENVFPVADASALEAGDTLIISAHGVDHRRLEEISDRGIRIIDATCPFVAEIHAKVKDYFAHGYGIIILGDAGHAEIKGIAGCVGGAQIVSSVEEIDLSSHDKYLVVCQTTFSVEKYDIIKNFIEIQSRILSKIVVFFNSICYTTKVRQAEAKAISECSDAVIVVGDKRSSNTLKLFETAKNFCKKVYLISCISDLKDIQIGNEIIRLGLLSGASAPKELIMEVIEVMNDQSINGNVEFDSTATAGAITNEAEVKAAEVVAANTEAPRKKNDNQEMSMEAAMKKYGPKSYREGMRLKAKVVSADMNGISVSVDSLGKNDSGFIDKSEAEIDGSYSPENYKVNDELDVVIIPKTQGDKSRMINLSKKAYDAIKVDDEKVTGILAGEEFSICCTQEIKGGLLGKIGTYTVFVPASQLKAGFVQNLADYINKPLRLKALPPKEDEGTEEGKRPRNPKRIVASQRIIIEEEKRMREDDFWASIPVGTIVHGKVKRFAAFGAFVSLKYMDALVHNSELSWSKKKINSPEEVLTLNKSYDFVVLAADRETGKISLGYKQLQPKPYELAAQKYEVGTVVTGTVVRVAKFGVFVELEPGIDGLVHISQINHGWTKSAGDSLKVGQEVEVKVIKFEDEKITLSIKDLLPQDAVENTPVEGEEKSFDKRKPRKDRFSNEEDGPREYISSTTNATLADLFKDFNN